MSDSHNSKEGLEGSLRELILGIDTTYRIDGRTTEGFIVPNFYLDRLVKAIDQYTEHCLETYRKSGEEAMFKYREYVLGLEEQYWKTKLLQAQKGEG